MAGEEAERRVRHSEANLKEDETAVTKEKKEIEALQAEKKKLLESLIAEREARPGSDSRGFARTLCAHRQTSQRFWSRRGPRWTMPRLRHARAAAYFAGASS